MVAPIKMLGRKIPIGTAVPLVTIVKVYQMIKK
jgi:hypothetical protein